MDRLNRPLVACGLGLLLASTGCRSTRNEVPPGRPYSNDGQQRQAISFSSDGHPTSAASGANLMPNNLGGSNLASGIGGKGPRPDGAAFGGPSGAYGPPGTSGLAQPPAQGDPAASRESGAPASMPPVEMPPMSLPPMTSPPAGAPAAPDLNVAPSRTPQSDPPNPIPSPPTGQQGAMGTPDQPPSPF